jgi:GT2 family glycosyltransferase
MERGESDLMATIIIPAHNEESVLDETLAALVGSGEAPPFRVVVVCNGCTDGTAGIARRHADRVDVIETSEASKTKAINVGESTADSYPRIVQDADVVLSGESAAQLVRALQAPGALLVEPRPLFETSRSPYPVRAFYRVWLALHGGAPGDIGGGVYGLTEEARSRFGAFPDVIADDAFVRAHFAPDEVTSAEGSTVIVRAPATTAGLVKIKTRSRLGQWEISRRYPQLWMDKRSSTPAITSKARRLPPRLWLDAPIYGALQIAIRLRAASMALRSGPYAWERDRR